MLDINYGPSVLSLLAMEQVAAKLVWGDLLRLLVESVPKEGLTSSVEKTMHGFYGRILKVDLSEEKYHIEAISDEMLERYLGGKGLASHLLYQLNPPGVEPLDSANCLIFAIGPVTGSAIMGLCRYEVKAVNKEKGL